MGIPQFGISLSENSCSEIVFTEREKIFFLKITDVVLEILLDVGATENDDMQTEASVIAPDLHSVCSSIVKNENDVDHSADNMDTGSAAVEETCVHEKESSPKHSKASRTSSAKPSSEVKSDGTKQSAS